MPQFVAIMLTVSLIVLGASHFSGQTVDGTYQQFKREHEMMLRSERIKEESVRQYQEEHRIWSRSLAKLLMNKDKKLGDGVSDSERGSNDA
ncbi:unnamed protein product [Litomosoides sigmodontis]|uniref:Uncharacterized protein n=1 Tax=Litomosoides sigmodontis TaxID=42156 RepID=A0A3P6TMA6_LITSI|nr:unnamed protein product [Litomosoides sigmodontis]